jgi:hypothetical protein
MSDTIRVYNLATEEYHIVDVTGIDMMFEYAVALVYWDTKHKLKEFLASFKRGDGEWLKQTPFTYGTKTVCAGDWCVTIGSVTVK